MKQPRSLIVCVILFLCISYYTGATTAQEIDQECGLEFTSIDISTITVFWNKTCFNDDSSYTLDVIGATSCQKTDIDADDCGEDYCEFETRNMICSGSPVTPCVPVSFTVTSNNNPEISFTANTTAAPFFPDGDWNLEASINGTSPNLTVEWGPLTGDYISCATDVLITAVCNETEVHAEINGLDPNVRATQEIPLGGCQGGPITDITVTYLSGDDPTEIKKTFEDDAPIYTAAPEAPSEMRIEGNDDTPTKLMVTWEKPIIGAEEMTGYIITVSPSDKIVDLDDTEAESYELTDLKACTDYTVSVAAKWSEGTGESGRSTGKTGSQAPGKPTDITSESLEKRKISVSWTAPIAENSCPITFYTVTWSPGEGKGNATGTKYNIENLSSNTEYTIDVTANTEGKTSLPSDSKKLKTKNLSDGDIAGIVCGTLAGVVLIALGIFISYKKKILCFESCCSCLLNNRRTRGGSSRQSDTV